MRLSAGSWRARRGCCIALLSALVVTGCGDQEVDGELVAKNITTVIHERAGIDVKSVECPSDLTASKGTRFTCTVTGTDGSSARVPVSLRDDDGHATIRFRLMKIPRLERSIAKRLTKQVGLRVTVRCRQIVRVKKGKRFSCRAKSSIRSSTDVRVTTTARIHVRITDGEGRYEYVVR